MNTGLKQSSYISAAARAELKTIQSITGTSAFNYQENSVKFNLQDIGENIKYVLEENNYTK